MQTTANPGIVYIATVLPGLEQLLQEELLARLNDVTFEKTLRGKVLFRTRLGPDALSAIRTADNLYQHLGSFPIGPHKSHLSDLEKRVASLDLAFMARRAPVRYVVNASRKGKQTYSRFEAADAAMRGIAARYPSWPTGTSDDHEMEFRLDIEPDEAMFSLRLTDASYRFRGSRSFAPAALRPTIAHALVWLSQPEASDVFLDPCCGSGTILAERAAYPSTLLLGGDLSDEAIAVARQNMDQAPSRQLRQWDARKLPLDSASVNKIVVNLPFGRQILHWNEVELMYREMIKEAARVMTPQGRAIFLTERTEELRLAAAFAGLACSELMTVSLKGLRPTIFCLEK